MRIAGMIPPSIARGGMMGSGKGSLTVRMGVSEMLLRFLAHLPVEGNPQSFQAHAGIQGSQVRNMIKAQVQVQQFRAGTAPRTADAAAPPARKDP